MGIIYKTTNNINGKFYVGKDKHNNPRYLGSGKILNRAIAKYGRDNFVKETIEECADINLDERERYWIEMLDATTNGYNITKGGQGGDTFSNQDEETKNIIREKCKTFLGRKHTPETLEKLRVTAGKAWKGKKQPLEMVQKRANSLRGRPDTRNYKPTDETKKKISEHNARYWLGKHIPDETVKKLNANRKNQDMSHLYASYTLIDPDGNEYIIKNSVDKFLKEFHLSKTQFYRMIRGGCESCGGWMMKDGPTQPAKYPMFKGKVNIKKYIVTDPDGNQYITDQGLTSFCESHGLTAPLMINIANGKGKQHKGWKCERLNGDDRIDNK